MGSVVSYDELCPACGKPGLFTDYYYRTGEKIQACSYCDLYICIMMRCDDSGNWVYSKKVYPLDRVVLAVFTLDTDELLQEQPLTPELTEDMIWSRLNEPVKGALAGLFLKSNTNDYERIMFSGCTFTLDREHTSLTIHKPTLVPYYCYPRSDGVTIDIHPFTSEEIARASEDGLKGDLLAEDHYVVKATDGAGNTAELYVEQHIVEQVGYHYIMEHTTLNVDHEKHYHLELDLAPHYNSVENYPPRTIHVAFVQDKPGEYTEVYRNTETGVYYLRVLARKSKIAHWMTCGDPASGYEDRNSIRANVTFIHGGHQETTSWRRLDGPAVYPEQFDPDFRSGK